MFHNPCGPTQHALTFPFYAPRSSVPCARINVLVEAPELADVVLVVEGERFPAHSVVLQEESGQQEIG